MALLMYTSCSDQHYSEDFASVLNQYLTITDDLHSDANSTINISAVTVYKVRLDWFNIMHMCLFVCKEIGKPVDKICCPYN